MFEKLKFGFVQNVVFRWYNAQSASQIILLVQKTNNICFF